MCYPKPGPRCSAHAAARMARAQHAALAYIETHRDDRDWDTYEKLASAQEDARAEYQITTAGIRMLERYAAEDPTDANAQMKLENARAERAARIAALKTGDQVDRKHEHQTAPKPISYSNTEFAVDGDHFEAFTQRTPDVTTLLDESEAWVNKLTADEIEALRWYSMAGYADVNGGLSNSNYKSQFPRGDGTNKNQVAVETIANLDSAIAKADSSKTAIVYRRHFFYTPEGKFTQKTDEELQAEFTVGEVYKPGFYMSNSINPDNAHASSGSIAALQIKVHRGAALPAVAAQGTGEMEILLPRNGQYRVVANDRKITITDRRGKTRTVRIIQMEEIA